MYYNLINSMSKGVSIPYNLFIGGVASTLSTASLLATKLGVSSSIITDYTIVGSDIKCVITTPFSMPHLSWKNDANVTYFLAYGSIITSIGIGNFENFANLKLFYCEGNPLFNTVFNARTRALTCELPQLTILAEAAFYTYTASNKRDIFYLPRCVQLGTSTSVNNDCFFKIGSGSIIYVDPFLQTCNAGSPDADLVYAVSRGAIVRYVTNFTAPSQITDLSAGTIYNTSIQLNFTAPSSTNAIDYYELYIDGVLQTQRITASGQFISGLTSSTSYSFTLKAVDIFYNKSVVSNSLSVSTTIGTNFLTNLVAYYSFDASNATDIHTGTHNGTVVGSPTFPSGKNGNCIDFGNDNNLNYVNIADSNDFSFTNGGGVDVPFTMSMWINLSAFSTAGSWFINKRPEINIQSNEYQLILLGSDLQMCKFDRDNSAIFQARSYAFSPSLSTWYHIVYTDNGSKNASGMKFYINGTLVTSSDISSGTYTGMPNGNGNVFVGTSAWVPNQALKFKGKMDELAIWKNRELSALEVTELYNAGAGKFYNTF